MPKTIAFDDLDFQPHPVYIDLERAILRSKDAEHLNRIADDHFAHMVQALVKLENGYVVSVVSEMIHKTLYEIAVIENGIVLTDPVRMIGPESVVKEIARLQRLSPGSIEYKE